MKKDLYRREGKGRRSFLGDGIPCRASYFPSGRVKEQADLHPILQFVLVQNSYCGKELRQLCLPLSIDDLCFIFCMDTASMDLTVKSYMRLCLF